ncbi:MAG: TrmH family RNA methyltransferase [Allobaculum sp.]
MEIVVSGTISVKAVLEEEKRQAYELYVNPKKRSRDIAYIIAIAKKQGVPVTFLSREEMNEMAPSNGGVILRTESCQFPSLTEDTPLNGLCVYISGVEDPYNLGSIARTLYAAGASLMIIQDRDWSSASAILLRASAGAWERLPIVTIQKDEQLIEVAEIQNRAICSASRDEYAKSLFQSKLPENLLLAIGGALRGLSSRILMASSEHLYIPYGREFRNALDSVSAAAVFSFYWAEQNNIKEIPDLELDLD